MVLQKLIWSQFVFFMILHLVVSLVAYRDFLLF